jgi:predicted TIM-barrel fold metal-dependent hydrolase
VRAEIDEGTVGLKMFPGFLGADLSSDEWLAVLRELERRGSRLLLSYEYLLPNDRLTVPDYLDQPVRALADVPDLPVVLLHARCIDPLRPAADRVIALVERHPRIVLPNGMPGAVSDDGCECPFANLLARVRRLHERVGAERLMWASDWPWFDHEMTYKQGSTRFEGTRCSPPRLNSHSSWAGPRPGS